MSKQIRKTIRKVFPKTPYPEENYDSFTNYWDDKKYPRRADVETTNLCNSKCLCCNIQNLERSRGTMTLDTFKKVADKLKRNNVLIRGMYTTGEPLLDPTLFQKFAYARQIKVMAPFVSLNTNVSLLVPEIFKEVLDNTDNITLSFFNVGKEYERLTGGLSWIKSYLNALNFINYRDHYRPDYRIFIGCNTVEGSNLEAVKNAFKYHRVEYAVDAELRWAGKVITGVVDRAIMHPTFRCDGHEGVLLIKWNLECEFCSYDFHGETKFCNVFEDDWSEIERKFKELWKHPSKLCARCSYWNLYWTVKKNNFKMVKDWGSWQKPFLGEGEKPQR